MAEKAVNMRDMPHTPNRAMVNVTGRCNSRCSYCRAWREGSGAEDPTRAELLDLMRQITELGCKAVGFSGGEPLLRDDLEEIIAKARECGLAVGMVSNGLLLTPERARGLAQAGLGGLSISLDSLDPVTYHALRGVSLDRVLAHLEQALALKVLSMGLATTISKHNVDALAPMAAFAQERGLMITFQLYESSVHLANHDTALAPSPEALQNAMDELRAMKRQGAPITNPDEYLLTLPVYAARREWIGLERCVAPHIDLCIDERCNVLPCWGLDRIMGSLREQSLGDIWRSEGFERQRRELAHCRQCILSCHFEISLRTLALLHKPKETP